MGGFFGGFLGLINAVGGGVLQVLIGLKAWNDNASGRHYRVVAGSIASGLVIGGILYVWLLEALFDDPFGGILNLLICFVGVPLVFLLIAGALEDVTNEIDEDEIEDEIDE
jgi:hypothetical protein